MRRFPIRFIVVLTLVAACSSSDSTGSNNTGTGTGTGLSATISGTDWAPAAKASAIYSNNIFVVSGLDLHYGLSVTVGAVTAAGTYSLNPGNLHAASAIVSNTTGGWGSAFANGSGTVTFTTLTASHAVGTFSFDATPGSGAATGTLHVTNGKFDVTY